MYKNSIIVDERPDDGSDLLKSSRENQQTLNIRSAKTVNKVPGIFETKVPFPGGAELPPIKTHDNCYVGKYYLVRMKNNIIIISF